MFVEKLNVKHASVVLPDEFEGYYDPEKYRKSQNYLKENTNFKIFTDTFFTVIKIVFIILGGFNFVDTFARSFNFGPIPTGLIFTGAIIMALSIITIPFSAYDTFVIEAKYGFNRTTVKTFVMDIIKGWLLSAVIGGLIFSGILWFFGKMGADAWIYCWSGLIVVYLFFSFIAPVIIMPIFNKFIPLEDGELKKSIEDYAKKQNFKLKGIFKMDGSKRSTKSNAFFTGFGKFRRIVLFDTLIEKHSINELVSILAHEVGHYKKKHIFKHMVLFFLNTGLMFYVLSFFINNQGLFAAFKMDNISIYASLIFFGFLYEPINLVISILGNVLSRKYEYESDAFAADTYGNPESMISALKKLSVDNLSNLTPHPLKVFLEYSHPPVLDRIKAIRKRA